MGDLFFFEEYILSRRRPQIRQGKRIDLVVKNSIDLTWLDTGYIPAVIMDSSMGIIVKYHVGAPHRLCSFFSNT
ncbi:hypothetical protein E4U28_002201 [Claviceps purpurea]|nr:hypothetical protein E4U28_002201 [Claviceps purpurea]